MTDLRAAAQQALEALTIYSDAQCSPKGRNAITALREALEQPEQEPVAKVVSTAPDRIWLDLGFDPQDETEVLFGELHDVTWSADNASGYGIEYVRATPTAAQPEPTQWRDMIVVTLVREGINKHKARELAGHFAAQRPWVGLTKVQRDDFADAYGSYQAVCDIEQALKELNNG
jgi:hypothetical protein